MSAGAAVFSAVSEAMRAVVREFPSGSTRPDWVEAFILAIGAPSDLAKVSLQMDADTTDAELWRFLLRTLDEDGPECAVMVSIMDELPPGATTDQAAFAAHVAKGLALFKAGG